MTPTDHPSLVNSLRYQANYLDTFGETDDGRLLLRAADELEAGQIVQTALIAALRHLTGDRFQEVMDKISNAMSEAIKARHQK